ncbi:MAG: HAMP domain-containing protein [Gemmatimonadetes bacterium]|nr:HAMP domain-containing protein [Gemmatimonadota bacterium]
MAFALALAFLAIGAMGYLWRESTRRLDQRLDAVAEGVAAAVGRELRDTPDSGLRYAAAETAKEWPSNGDAFVIVDGLGAELAAVGREGEPGAVLGAWTQAKAPRFEVPHEGAALRASAVRTSLALDARHAWKFGVVAFSSTEGVRADTELLAGGLAVAAPLIVLLSLAAGYGLAGRALRPVDTLGNAIAAMAPSDLSRRLPVERSFDEVGRLAGEFNGLLDRLEEAQRRNRGFIREAAHQLRTPLTLVLGEAGHELSASDANPERTRGALGRVRVAAERMRRRVDELFLLAEARSGEPVRLEDDVELDGLVLECTDLMRARATGLGRSLAIGDAPHVMVRGNAALLQEALMELVENACRHGSAEAPVTVSVHPAGRAATIEVSSAGHAFALPVDARREGERGLGLTIVQWIAGAHGGSLRVTRRGALNVVALELPVDAAPPPSPAGAASPARLDGAAALR